MNALLQVSQPFAQLLQWGPPCRKPAQAEHRIHLKEIQAEHHYFKWTETEFVKLEIVKTLPARMLLKPLIVSLRGTSLPKWPVKTSATWKG